LLFYFRFEHFIKSISTCLLYKVAWFRYIATYPRHYVKVLPKSECCTQACTTGLSKYILILIQYLNNYNTIRSACKPDLKTLAPLRRREPSSLASDLTGLVRSLLSSSAPKSKSLSLSTRTKVSVQRAAWSRYLQLS
jgi:hypothetical protein